MFNPLTQLNYFFRLATDRKLSGSDQLMYLHIFNKFNQAHWTETLRIKDAELKDLLRLYDSNGKPASIDVIRRGRQRLTAKGFINVLSKGEDGLEPTYQLICFDPANPPADPPPNPPANPPSNPPADPLAAPNIRAGEDVKTLDVKTSHKQARARVPSEDDDIFEYWREMTESPILGINKYDLLAKAEENSELTKRAIVKAMQTKTTYVLQYEHFKKVYIDLKNPKPKPKPKGSENVGKREYAKPPEYDFLDEWERSHDAHS